MATRVTLYGDIDFRQIRGYVGVGRYATMAEAGFLAGDISSFVLPAGLKFTVYTKANFAGESGVFLGPTSRSDLQTALRSSGGNWNDAIYSMVVEPTAVPTSTVGSTLADLVTANNLATSTPVVVILADPAAQPATIPIPANTGISSAPHAQPTAPTAPTAPPVASPPTSSAPAPAPAPAPATTGNTPISGSEYLYIFLGLIVLVIALAYIFFRGKKKSKRFRLSDEGTSDQEAD